MPSASVLAPTLLLAVAGLLAWGLGRAGVRSARLLVPAAAWLALGALLGVWFGAGRVALELNLPGSLAGAPLTLRLDAVAVAFGAIVLVPAALLFSFQDRTWQEAAVGALAASASLLAAQAGSVLLTAVALSSCASLVLVALRLEDAQRSTTGYWVSLSLAALVLLWAGTVLEVTGGTSVYSAAPITALSVPVFLLLATAGLLCSGLLPARTWVSEVWRRDRLEAGALAVVLLTPAGFLLLTRAYVLGAGQWPSPALNLALAAVGAATALAAGLRAQAAVSRRDFLGEAIPLTGGLALLSLALGSPFGVTAAILTLAGGALIAALVPLLPAADRPAALLGLALIVGVPPALVFGGRLLALQAAIEAGPPESFLALAGIGAWLLAVAGVARVPRLPVHGEPQGSRLGGLLALGLCLLGGVGLGALATVLAVPVAGATIGSPSPTVSGGYLSVQTASGGWAALTLGGPLLLLAIGAAFWSRRAWSRWPSPAVSSEGPPRPLLEAPFGQLGARLRARWTGLRVPGHLRSVLDLASLERAASSGRPLLWGAVTLVLIVAVTR
jgi:hypothetical protein